jgi:hypothetical protein
MIFSAIVVVSWFPGPFVKTHALPHLVAVDVHFVRCPDPELDLVAADLADNDFNPTLGDYD